jgi:chemotaxis protein MotB
MADASEKAPIIIKKIKKGGHGHHGGAWKVAYADFVTAMMAFFLLLWLLSSTTEEQREGIADYFTPTIGLKDAMGVGVEGGETPTEEGEKKSELTDPGIVFGAPPTGPVVKEPVDTPVDYEAEAEKMVEVQKEVQKTIKEQLGRFEQNLMVEHTPEGLKIQLVDQDKTNMFESGSYVLTDAAKAILKQLLPILEELPNRVAITGHTDASSYGVDAAYSNWELSADRANATRRYFRQIGMKPDKVVAVTGKADKDPLIPQDPEDDRNRRISMILLHRHIYPFELPAPPELLEQPKPDAPSPSLKILQ